MNRVSPILALLLSAFFALNTACARKPDDAKISSAIENKFSQDSGLSGKQLSVQASNGVVTLAGLVDNDVQRQTASRQAASVDGVKQVINNLQVGNASSSAIAPIVSAPIVSKPVNSAEKPVAANRSRRSKDLEKVALNTSTMPADGAAEQQNSVNANQNPQDPPPSVAPPAPAPPAPLPPPPQKLTVEQGTPISVRLIDSIDSEKNQVGDPFHATLNSAIEAQGTEAIPAGTDVTGHVVEVKSAGKFSGQSLVVLRLDSITADGKSYVLQTDQYRKEGASRGKGTAEKVGGGAVIGGIIGAIAGGGKGAAIGSAAGAGVGGGAQAASKSQPIKLPSETVLNFTLEAPVTVIRQAESSGGRQKLGDSQ